MFKLAVFPDEISQDPAHAATVAGEYHLPGVELRNAWSKGPHEYTPDDVAKLRDIFAEARLTVCSIASPFFKCDIDSDEECREHLDILRCCIALGREFDCTLIRGFAFWRKDGLAGIEKYWDRIVARFAEVVKLIEGEGVTLGLENEASTFIGTGARLAQFLGQIDSPNLRATWDPMNAVWDLDEEERVYPDGYEAVKPYLVHVHVKDVRVDRRAGTGEAMPVGEGDVNWRSQFQALRDDGYDGWASLETHYRIQPITQEQMDRPGGAGYTDGAEEGSRRCLENMQAIWKELGWKWP